MTWLGTWIPLGWSNHGRDKIFYLLSGESLNPKGFPDFAVGITVLFWVPYFSSVQSLSHVRLCNSMNTGTPGIHVHHRLPEFTHSCPSSWWCHPAISSSVIPFSSFPPSFPASGSFPVSQLFASGGQSIGVSASASVLPMNTQDWSPLGWTGWISLPSKGLSTVFSNTTLQKHQFLSV